MNSGSVVQSFSGLTQGEAAKGVFTDAAEVEGVVVLDDVCDLEVAVGGGVLEVVGDAAVRVETENKGVALWGGLERLR